MLKGKLHGTVDVGLSVLTYKRRGRRFDIDTEDVIYHLKVKRVLVFHLVSIGNAIRFY